MIRHYDLSMEVEPLEDMLNDPEVRVLKMNIGCLVKSGYTTATLHFDKPRTPIIRKRRRKVERYILFNGMNTELDKVLENPRMRILNKHEFVTEQGVIIVVDYEYLIERS